MRRMKKHDISRPDPFYALTEDKPASTVAGFFGLLL